MDEDLWSWECFVPKKILGCRTLTLNFGIKKRSWHWRQCLRTKKNCFGIKKMCVFTLKNIPLKSTKQALQLFYYKNFCILMWFSKTILPLVFSFIILMWRAAESGIYTSYNLYTNAIFPLHATLCFGPGIFLCFVFHCNGYPLTELWIL